MAGRSSRSYFDEGRLDDLKKAIKSGDYLFMQFAHNDANKEKEERYVTPKQYEEYLLRYINAAKECGAQPVVTAIAMRDCDDTPDGKFSVSFPEYRDKMLEMGDKYDLPVLDLGKATADYLNTVGSDGSKKLFMWLIREHMKAIQTEKRTMHIYSRQGKGICRTSCGLIRSYERDDKLDKVKAELAKNMFVAL